MRVPADLRRRIEDAAAGMGVPPSWVLRACVDIALSDGDGDGLALVFAVEHVRDNTACHVARKPRSQQ